MATDRFTLKHWRGSDINIERVYVTGDDGEGWGFFERLPDTEGVSWRGVDGGSPKVLDALFGARKIGRHASWRVAGEEGDEHTIWRALLYVAGVKR